SYYRIMKTNIWGPYAWLTLHVIPFTSAIRSPSQPCVFAVDWLQALHKTLPCSECQQHYGWYIQSNPIPSHPTPLELADYICRLHNHVSASTGSKTWSCQEVYDLYGFNPKKPSISYINFWSRNWIVFIYLALHSPQVEWSSMKKFMSIKLNIK
ncbi:MAG: hypothetical protein EBU01_16470, partial [Crocinitomicaceae bacterium]|nr:hypothetical protein [Crocinitomicaceae bacterium]